MIPRRLLELIIAVAAAGLAILLIGPVAATVLTPGWLDGADFRDWAGTVFFLCGAVALVFVAWRLARPRSRPARGLFSARDWWGLAALSLLATLAAALASHWTIALPGLLPSALAIAFARRRARELTVARALDPSSSGKPHEPDVASIGPT